MENTDPSEDTIKVDETQVVATLATVKLPTPFWRSNPRRYFTVAEMKFELHRITSDNSKFRHIATNLDPDLLDIVGNIIDNPPATGRYEALKEKLISALSESSEARIRRLLRGQPLGDEKPTVFLQRIRNLIGSDCNQPAVSHILRSLFLEQMPDAVKTVLAANTTDDIDALALQANSVLDVVRPQVFQDAGKINVVDHLKRVEKENVDVIEELREMNRELVKRIDKLSIRVDKLARGRSRSRERSKNARSVSKDSKGTLCYYHENFGEDAHKCRNPCSWKKQEN